MRIASIVTCSAVAFMLGLSPTSAQKRVALVVGNGKYEHVASLLNPGNDAELMALTLKSLGFTLIGGGAQIDLDKAAFDKVVQNFSQQIQGAEVSLFYYAGHGLQVRGTNYLVPTGANPTREADLDFQMLDTNVVLRQMEGSGTKLNIVLLDACRNNPFGGRGLRSSDSGLAQMKAPEGTLISYATQPGNVALDGADGNSPYTKALSQTMVRAGLDIFQTFNEVGLVVKNATGGSQQPWVSSSPITGSFYFSGVPATGGGSSPLPRPAADPAERTWSVIQNTTSIGVLESFIQQHGNTIYGSMARARVEELKKSQIAIGIVPSKITVNPLPAERERVLKPKESFTECDACPELVVVPAGTFTMGSPESETDRNKNEGPQRKVTIAKNFAVAKFEVTFDQYAAFITDSGYDASSRCSLRRDDKWFEPPGLSWRNPNFPQTGNHPAVCISWIDAKAYVAWLSRKTGKTYRLLTEAEWEYAARAGTTTKYYFGNDQNTVCRHANGPDQTARSSLPQAKAWNSLSCTDGHAYTAPVGSFPANAFGLHDMLGNVFEWTEDCGNDSYSGAPVDGAAWSTGNCNQRVVRGGSYGRDLKDLRSAMRLSTGPTIPGIAYGFRVARTLNP